MAPTRKEPKQTPGEETNRKPNNASETHAAKKTVPTGSENDTTIWSRGKNDTGDAAIQNRGHLDNGNAVSRMNTAVVLPKTIDFKRHMGIMMTLMIAYQVIYICTEDAQHGLSVRITPMMGGNQSQGQMAVPHTTEEQESLLEKITSTPFRGRGRELERNGTKLDRVSLGSKDMLRPVGIHTIVSKTAEPVGTHQVEMKKKPRATYVNLLGRNSWKLGATPTADSVGQLPPEPGKGFDSFLRSRKD